MLLLLLQPTMVWSVVCRLRLSNAFCFDLMQFDACSEDLQKEVAVDEIENAASHSPSPWQHTVEF